MPPRRDLRFASQPPGRAGPPVPERALLLAAFELPHFETNSNVNKNGATKDLSCSLLRHRIPRVTCDQLTVRLASPVCHGNPVKCFQVRSKHSLRRGFSFGLSTRGLVVSSFLALVARLPTGLPFCLALQHTAMG